MESEAGEEKPGTKSDQSRRQSPVRGNVGGVHLDAYYKRQEARSSAPCGVPSAGSDTIAGDTHVNSILKPQVKCKTWKIRLFSKMNTVSIAS